MADTFSQHLHHHQHQHHDDQQQQNKKQHKNILLKLTTSIFFISSFAFFFFFLLFSSQSTFSLFLSPSLYTNLFSPSSKPSAFNHTHQVPTSETPQNVAQIHKDSNFIDNHTHSHQVPTLQTPQNVAQVDQDSNFNNNHTHSHEKPTSEMLENDNIVPVEPVILQSNDKDPNLANDTHETTPEKKWENGGEIGDGGKNGDMGIVEGSVGENGSVKKVENVRKRCDLYMGKWVRDDGYPVYNPGSCPYVDEAFDCQRNGRPDLEYLKWRWQPDDCDLPRFNATDFLIRLRGKSLMLVGDSMNRNQFESMLCVLRKGLSDKRTMYEVHGYKITKGRGFYIFKFVDFNCTIQFVRSHFLVKEGLRINGQGNTNPTLSIDRIDKTANKWKRADILVFNTGHWWSHGKTSRGMNYFKEGDQIYPKFDSVKAYRRALKTWGEWIDKNLDPAKQMVFYRGYSSAHFRGGDWDSGGTCNGEKEPIVSGAFLDTYPLKMKIVEEVIEQMKFPVVLLNVTRLTNFRKDGHPSIYGKVRAQGTKVSGRKQDCSHWCLPGVPDAWNELIYASLVFQ